MSMRPVSRRPARFALAAAASLTLLGTVVLTGPAASAATPTCSDSTVVSGPQGDVVVPSTASGNTTCNMVRGDNSQAVLQLQATLNVCYGKNLVEDGDFGGNTYTALRQVQAAIGGLTVDGQYGPHTRNAMHFMEAESDGIHIHCYPY